MDLKSVVFKQCIAYIENGHSFYIFYTLFCLEITPLFN